MRAINLEQLAKTLSTNAPPVIADLLGVALYLFLLPRLITQFQQKSYSNAVLVGGAYLLFCLSVYIIRRQPDAIETGPDSSSRGVLGFLGAAFGIFVTYMIAESAGLFDRLDAVDTYELSPVASIGVLVGVTVWLVLVFLYTAIVVLEIKPTERRLLSADLLSLVGVNLMILITVAYWRATFADAEPYEGLALGGKILIFLAIYAFFVFFFAPPRMLFLLRQPTIPATVSFLVQTGYFVWNSLNQVAWR